MGQKKHMKSVFIAFSSSYICCKWSVMNIDCWCVFLCIHASAVWWHLLQARMSVSCCDYVAFADTCRLSVQSTTCYFFSFTLIDKDMSLRMWTVALSAYQIEDTKCKSPGCFKMLLLIDSQTAILSVCQQFVGVQCVHTLHTSYRL